MPSDYELTISRYQTFLRDVLEPAVYPLWLPLTASAHQITDIKSELPGPEIAAARDFVPVEQGWTWGPKWSTCWFRVRGSIPAEFDGMKCVARFSSGTEAQIWLPEGKTWTPGQGLDVNRDSWPLDATVSREVDLLIEAACNHPFGVLGFEWDPSEVHARWKSSAPGRLERCEVAVIDPVAWELRHRYAFALGLLKEHAENSNRAQDLFGALRRATNAAYARPRTGLGAQKDHAIKGTLLALDPEGAEEASTILAHALESPAGGSTTVCHAVGHAHIDTAWLWPLRETRRKCIRSFSNQLRLMEQFPDYKFLCSQAQQYAWIEEQAPSLFTQIKARVEEGRWEPGGAMWIEPDANCPSGESLVRQILHGTGYWRERFGPIAEQHFLYLPDTFGFPASLPQIMSQAGLTTFITNKMIWNRSNVFPHTTFVWRGIDGSEVLAHNTPGHDYNAVNTPKELHRGEVNHRTKTVAPAAWLQPFGYGDGGGGPTDWSIRYAQYAANCDGMPRVKLSTPREFCREIHEQHAATRGTPEAFPTWNGELYLEIHRGTLTTQAWIKAANRRAEEDLRFAELLTFAGPASMSEKAQADAGTKLDRAWKTLLLQQFHDILPGSSIAWVYEDSRRDFARIAKITDALIEKGTTAWLSGLSSEGTKQPMGVFNPCSSDRSAVIELPDGALAFARNVPALGVAVVDRAASPGCVPVKLEDKLDSEGLFVLSNGMIRAEITDRGEVVSLQREGTHRDLVFGAGGEEIVPMNQLVLYEDVPHMWDAWDIDPTYEHKPTLVDSDAISVEVVSESPLRCAVKIVRPLGGGSQIEQTFSLDAASPRLDIHTKVDWHEHRSLLRVLFPTNIESDTATYEIQFGAVKRPTHRSTTWDSAKFEVCAHRWMDLSERGAGLSLINDCKYGHSCLDGTMGLSLLRATKHPDPEADLGAHEFSYALLPHEGDWQDAGVVAEAEAFNTPPVAYVVNPDEPGPLGNSWAPLRIETNGTAAVSVSALKPSEDGSGHVLRLWECHGGRGEVVIRWNIPAASASRVDLLERETAGDIDHEEGVTRIMLRPWEIVSVRVGAE
jgi:alpha-mannosidase